MTPDYKTREIGETFNERGVNLRVEKATHNCEGCFFNSKIYCCPESVGNCGHNTRPDNEDIIFTRIN